MALGGWLTRLRQVGDIPLADERRQEQVLEKLARAIVARRLEAPATLFLEVNRPLGFLFSQAAFFARPFLAFFLPAADVEAAAEILARPEALDRLLARIEELSRRGEDKRGDGQS